jgi:hypothetical protein
LQIRKRLVGIGALAVMASTACGFPTGLNATNPFALSPAPGGFAAVNAPMPARSLQMSSTFVEEEIVNLAPVANQIASAAASFHVNEITPAAASSVDAAIEESAVDTQLAALVAEPTSISFASFRLSVPFRTQKDGSAYQGSNCGPASLGMVLDAFGIRGATNDDLRYATHEYQGTLGRRGGTALQHMASAGVDHGLTPIGLYNGKDFASWSVDDVRTELRAGRPVIALVKYRLLPGYEGSTVRFDHYIVLHGISGDGFLYHDPAQGTAADGAGRWISAEQLASAMGSASLPGQAVAFDAAGTAPLAVTQLRG